MGKYRAVPTVLDGVRFASKKEASRYAELKVLERSGAIRNLELQPRYPILINGVKCFTWVADFRYFENEKTIVEDCKGFRTPLYKLKKKCVEAAYSLVIRET